MKNNKPKVPRISYRSLSDDEKRELRRKLYEKFLAKARPSHAGAELGLTYLFVHRIYQRFAVEGEAAIAPRRRMKKEKITKNLNEKDWAVMWEALSKSTPKQEGLPFALWSGKALIALAQKKLGKTICHRTAKRFLAAMGLTSRNPRQLITPKTPKVVRRWLEEDWYAVKQIAIYEKQRVWWAGTSVLKRSDEEGGSSNVLSAVNNQGNLLLLCYQGKLTPETLRAFFEGMIADIPTGISLVAENDLWRAAEGLKSWFETAEKKSNFHITYRPTATVPQKF